MAETIGLDIGSHSVKLVGIKMTSKGPFLTHAGIKEIPYSREKEDLNFISEAIKALFREVGLKPGKVRLTVSGLGVHITQITVPSMPKKELIEAVRWEIKDRLPFPIESAQIDFHILNEFVENNVKKLNLIVVACPNQLIDRALSIAEGAGLKPTHLDVGPFALWNALLTFDQFKKEGVIALIDLGAEKTGIHIFKDQILQFSREVTPAGADMTRTIMEEMSSRVEPDLLYEQAEKMKQGMGIPSKDSYERIDKESTNLSKIIFLVRPVLERLVSEIRRSLDYYRSQFNVERIDRVLLTGGSANLINIDSYLLNELQLPTEYFNPFSEIPFDSKKINLQVLQALDQMSSMFTVAIGVALPQFKRIELLPPKEPILTRARMEKWAPILSPLIILLIFLWIVWDIGGQVAMIKKERDVKMAKVKTLETLQAKLTLLKNKENQIRQDLSLFPASMIVPVPFREILKSVSHIVPDNATVAILSIQNIAKPSKGEPQTEGRRELQITGLSFGSDLHCLTALAQIIERLDQSPLFKNAKLISANENKLYTLPGTDFEILCDIELNGQKRKGKP
jgi:type IV pilus assembly protein PilM